MDFDLVTSPVSLVYYMNTDTSNYYLFLLILWLFFCLYREVVGITLPMEMNLTLRETRSRRHSQRRTDEDAPSFSTNSITHGDSLYRLVLFLSITVVRG